MPATNRPINESQSRTHWGAPKRCRSLSMTDAAWEMLSTMANTMACNRSEVIERLIRKAVEWQDA